MTICGWQFTFKSPCVNTSGDVPEAPLNTVYAVCIYANGTWDTQQLSNFNNPVCELTGIDILLSDFEEILFQYGSTHKSHETCS